MSINADSLPGISPFRKVLRKWSLIALITLITAVALAALVMRVTEAQLRKDAQSSVNREQSAINNAVERSRHLPVSLAHHPYVIAALLDDSESADTASDQVNLYLEKISAAAGTSLLYIIDEEGLTHASSNWRSDQSLVGNNYQFRPYFQDALLGEEARYYAVGYTTGEAGYYFAEAVLAHQQIIGVAVAKIDLESLQEQWFEKQTPALLVDEHGVIIMASEQDWRFRSTRSIGHEEKAVFQQQRKYAHHALEQLQTDGSLKDRYVKLDGSRYLVNRAHLPLQNWQILQLTPIAPIYKAGLVSILASTLLIGLSIVAYLYRQERQRRNTLRAAALDAATMRKLNRQLQAEISDRRKAEEDLREAQAELIQASKLAALGQMSAAIAHEVNQPLSAIRTFSASAGLLLERGRHVEVHANLEKIKTLTERLATLTTDLKSFARKSDQAREPVMLQTSINSVRNIISAEIAERGIKVDIQMPTLPVHVMGTAMRVEQVLSNLLRNAMDATEEVQQPGNIQLSLNVEENNAVIRVRDNGAGLDSQAMEHLFEPFFTTKPMGEGVGLGLAISYGIVEELGGQLRVRNVDDGGALFSVRLPTAPSPDQIESNALP